MKNVTITLEEEVLKWAKVTAAQQDTSVSRMLGEELDNGAQYFGITVENPFHPIS